MATVLNEMDPSGPLVSCLMVTLPVPQRFDYARASLDAFCRQTYPHKELVLVINGGTLSGRQSLMDHVSALNCRDIRIVEPAGEHTLGALRNISLENAAGGVVCQWDDDDLHHPERLQRQLDALLPGGHDALFLQDVLQYFPHPQKLYWTNWRATQAGGHPGTLMARSTASIRYPVAGQDARLGEDLRVALALMAQGQVGYLAAMPHLFIYVSHGENSWNSEHHRRLVEDLAISPGLLRRREAEIREGLRPFGFAPNELQVTGNTGLAFVI
jgi:glycosyltransferase involved in cell wall biosynthesis